MHFLEPPVLNLFSEFDFDKQKMLLPACRYILCRAARQSYCVLHYVLEHRVRVPNTEQSAVDVLLAHHGFEFEKI